MDPYNPEVVPPLPSTPAEEEQKHSAAGAVGDVLGAGFDGADAVAGIGDAVGSAASAIGDVASGAAEVVGEVASSAGEAAGAVVEGIGAVAEGCGSCSLAVLVMLASVGAAVAAVLR